jgi:predicted ATPase
MKRYILTGAPGAGKTTLLRQLERAGCEVVEEAATDFNAQEIARGVAEPWRSPGFIEGILALQKARQLAAAGRAGAIQVHDRSAICTLALCRWLERPVPASLAGELERIEAERIFERRVFFVANLGFVEPTQVRRISFEDSLKFERVHEDAYRELGYDCVRVEAAPVEDRVAAILGAIGA